jgi:hypothetical protein
MATHQATGKDLRIVAGSAAWPASSRNSSWAVDRTAHRVGIHHRATTTTTAVVVSAATTTIIAAITTIAAVAAVEDLEASETWQAAF